MNSLVFVCKWLKWVEEEKEKERRRERLNNEGENRVKFKGSSRVGLSWGMVHEYTQMKVCSTQSLKMWIVLLSLRRLSLHEQNCLTV